MGGDVLNECSWWALPPYEDGVRSTKAFSRRNAWSHCAAITSSARRASSMREGCSSHSRSRPWRMSCTRPAPASTSRCFVMAWRVTAVPAVSCVMDSAPPAQRAATSRKRVGSPSAAKTGGDLCKPCARDLRIAPASLKGEVLLDQFHLVGPTALVGGKCLGAALRRQLVEARFGDGQQDTVPRIVQFEHDQCHRLAPVVHVLFHAVGMPAERDALHRLDRFNHPCERRALVGLLHRGHVFVHLCRDDAAGQLLARHERTVEADAEPDAELVRFTQRAPYPFARGFQQDLLLDAIGVRVHRGLRWYKCNRKVAW